jgi:peptidoglycan/xylan/chitin deacetylase (PgdA/CDA1 family)
MSYRIVLLFLCSFCWGNAAFANEATIATNAKTSASPVMLDNLVILQYHHVSTKTPASTSISPEKFAEHLAYLYRHFTVVDLFDAIKTLRAGNQLPDKAVAITFDDGFDNILLNAHPLLRNYDFPYTIFINPERIDKDRNQLTWDEVKQMSQENVKFANHTLDHLHLLNREYHNGEKESDAEWLTRIMYNIDKAEALIEAQLGYSLQYLAYPYGEFNTFLAQHLEQQGYISFAQHSGAVFSGSNYSALPRFPAAGRYANLNTLKVKMKSLAMPVLDNNIDSPVVSEEGFPSTLKLTVSAADLNMHAMNCFYQGHIQDKKLMENTVEVSLPEHFPVGRSRMNCTAPSKSQKGRFYWFSQPFFKANKNHVFPD